MPSPSAPSKSLSDALDAIRKKDSKLQIGSLADFDLTATDAFSTGNIALDSITGVWGFPRGRVVELLGVPQSGKTTSALQAAAIHQKRVQAGEDEGAILFLDYERSLDENYCRALGLDVTDDYTFIYMQPRSFEQGANAFRTLLNGGYLAMGIADSVAAMVSEKELEAETGAVTMADRAKALHQFMRQITGALHEHRVTLLMLNHVMDVIDTSYIGQQMAARGIKKTTSPGGKALGYYAGMRISFAQPSENKSEVVDSVTQESVKLVTSTFVEAKVIKNKVGIPHRVAKLRVNFGKGFSQAYSVFQILVGHGIIKKKPGGHFVFREDLLPPDLIVPVGEENVISKIEAEPVWLRMLVAEAREVLEEELRIHNVVNTYTGEVHVD
jgi:recombination protein RecA